jgi:hypothetical protein
MKTAEISPVERRVRLVRGLGLSRIDTPDYRLYERLKAEFVRDFPAASQAEYERVMREIARVGGVMRFVLHWIKLRSFAAARWLRAYERAERRYWR